jgi:hypothetical protein
LNGKEDAKAGASDGDVDHDEIDEGLEFFFSWSVMCIFPILTLIPGAGYLREEYCQLNYGGKTFIARRVD